MEQKLIRFLADHHVTLKNKKIIVAVSGGPDSVALLHVLHKWRDEADLHIVAVTIDHQLRGDAAKDVQYVRNLCATWNIRLISETVDVRAYEERHKVSMQVAARELRYEVFAKVMKAENAHYLALGHHGDDQIETLVMSLMRTTNLAGLTGIPFRRPFARGEIIRPLLAVTKKEVEYYCRQHHLTTRIDPSNQDISYTRNYVRKLIVPKLKEKNPSLHITMQQLSETLRQDEAYIEEQAQIVFERIVQCDTNKKKASINIAQLCQYAIPLQRRIYRLILDYLYEQLPSQLSYSHEQIFLSLIKEDVENKRLHFPQQLIIEVVYDYIELYFDEEKNEPFSTYVSNVPTTVALPDGHVLEITYTNDIARFEEDNEYICAASEVTFPLQIRTRKPGDRMRYRGLSGSKKIKDIFIDEKIPRNERDDVLMVTDATDEVLWLIGIRKGEVKKQTKDGNLALSFIHKS